jgi:hypothetical protein
MSVQHCMTDKGILFRDISAMDRIGTRGSRRQRG